MAAGKGGEGEEGGGGRRPREGGFFDFMQSRR